MREAPPDRCTLRRSQRRLAGAVAAIRAATTDASAANAQRRPFRLVSPSHAFRPQGVAFDTTLDTADCGPRARIGLASTVVCCRFPSLPAALVFAEGHRRSNYQRACPPSLPALLHCRAVTRQGGGDLGWDRRNTASAAGASARSLPAGNLRRRRARSVYAPARACAVTRPSTAVRRTYSTVQGRRIIIARHSRCPAPRVRGANDRGRRRSCLSIVLPAVGRRFEAGRQRNLHRSCTSRVAR